MKKRNSGMRINGVPVVDAKKPAVIHINKRDVTVGNTKDPGNCAAALACMREFKAAAARVHVSRIYLLIKNKWLRYQTPTALRSEIVAFDRGGKFAPGEYVLNPLSPSFGNDYHRKRHAERKINVGKGKKRRYHTVSDIRHHGAVR